MVARATTPLPAHASSRRFFNRLRKPAAAIAMRLGRRQRLLIAVLWMLQVVATSDAGADNWPGWRGPGGNATSSDEAVVLQWSPTSHVVWKVALPGEGSSSPIVWGDRVFVTGAVEDGTRRQTHCLQFATGERLWTREIHDENPEITSALTGHAAPTPVTNGAQVVAFFGNAGLVAYDYDGRRLWHRDFGEFESELGIASSPILVGEHVIQLCDHDGKFYRTFDSFMICLEAATGRQLWKTNRRGLERSWSTPLAVPVGRQATELVVNAQDELRGYSPTDGSLLWRITGMTGWVTPSPVYANGVVMATSGKDGPLLAIRPGGRGDVTSSHVVWSQARGGPYVCSPLVYQGRLYVLNETGILSCFRAETGERLFRQRLAGKFIASPIAVAGHLLVTNEGGTTYVWSATDKYQQVAENRLEDECLTSPAVSRGKILIRTKNFLWCLGQPDAPSQ